LEIRAPIGGNKKRNMMLKWLITLKSRSLRLAEKRRKRDELLRITIATYCHARLRGHDGLGDAHDEPLRQPGIDVLPVSAIEACVSDKQGRAC
jgi:hypothetical protein